MAALAIGAANPANWQLHAFPFHWNKARQHDLYDRSIRFNLASITH
jgi:hypothetical protein